MTLHGDAVRTLEGWRPPDPAQDRLRGDFLRHLAAYDDALWRACAPGHLTASTLVLDASGSRVLLTLHGKQNMWLQLGGHCEAADGTLQAAALREATEESGITGLQLLPGPLQLDRHKVFCHPEGTYHLDVQYLAVAPPDAQPKISEESDDLRWFGTGALPELTDDAVRRLVARALDHPLA